MRELTRQISLGASGILFLLVSLAFTSVEGSCQSIEEVVSELQRQVETLNNKVETLEDKNRDLEHQLREKTIDPGASPKASSEVASRILDNEQVDQAQEARLAALENAAAEKAKKSAFSLETKFPAKLYGNLRLDTSYDEGEINEGNFARWVEPEVFIDDDEQFNMTARQSRLGIDFAGPSTPWLETSAKLEIDFFEGGKENKNTIQMRHAYLKLRWPQQDLNLLAGQTWDVISPLNPSTLNYSVEWFSGNIGYRRPQLRLEKGYQCGGNTRLLLQAAMVRNIGHTDAFSDVVDTGEDAGIPGFQGRLAVSRPIGYTGKEASIGVSGHWQREDFHTPDRDDHTEYDSQAGALDLTLPLTSLITLKAEAFKGKNLDMLLGGIGQGINMVTMEEIESQGGWAQLSVGPICNMTYSVGAAIDDPDDNDLANGARSKNTSYWANILYDINEAVTVGFELSKWETEYKNLEDGDSLRFQTSFIYKF
ncbi:MAG: hypothetical protein H6751_05320 [Candidatus Omnitrophica bacterium]|nr:hypothetical protein [Candidatus Omnitrophota bacterium]